MTPLGMLVIGCATVAAAYQLFQVFAAWWFFRRALRAEAAATDTELPPVTVLKPLKGLGVDLYDNLASFCRQDYPAYQIVFGISDVDDPALTVVQQIRRDFPGHDIVLSIGNAPGANRKVANLRHIRNVKHEFPVSLVMKTYSWATARVCVNPLNEFILLIARQVYAPTCGMPLECVQKVIARQ